MRSSNNPEPASSTAPSTTVASANRSRSPLQFTWVKASMHRLNGVSYPSSEPTVSTMQQQQQSCDLVTTSAPSASSQNGLGASGGGASQLTWRPSQDLMSDSGWHNRAPLTNASTAGIWKSPFDFGSPLSVADVRGINPSEGRGGSKGWEQPQQTTWSSVIGSQLGRPGTNNSNNAPSNGLMIANGVCSSSSSSSSPAAVLCSACEEKHAPATSRCRDCAEDLCGVCVEAHQRVKLTRDHIIVSYSEPAATDRLATLTLNGIGGGTGGAPRVTPPSVKTPPVAEMQAPQLITPSVSGVQNADVMRVYANAVEKAKAESERLLLRTKQGLSQVNEAIQSVAEMESRVTARHAVVLAEVKSISQRYLQSLKDRESILTTRLSSIHSIKVQTLIQQKGMLSECAGRLRKLNDQLAKSSSGGAGSSEVALIETCQNAVVQLEEVRSLCGSLTPREDDVIQFIPPDPNVLDKMTELGFVAGSGFAHYSRAEGDGLRRAIVGKDATFSVIVHDQLNEQRRSGADPVKVSVTAPDGRPVRLSIFDGQTGRYRAVWRPHVDGEHLVAVTIKDLHVRESPFRVNVRSGRNYSSVGTQIFEFGTEGEGDGQLCRPWGVACSRDGLILVANRSNNRIEVFTKDGRFHHRFGSTGKGPGQFDRPASVCCDGRDRVIVADKDNHRIQIFTIEGEYLLAFGEKGSKTGFFNYPWDVACNSKDEILVSDTRNHRIQLFSPTGEFIHKYGFDGAMWKHFDSPRGVCFTADDQPVVTDFNNHRLLVVNADFQKAQFLGKEGTEDGAFTRPNGVAVDEEGHIIVADSRNDRVQIFSSSGVFLKKFGSKGKGKGEFDRPSGICLSPEGHLIVVDFGNSRVQVF